MTNYEIITSMSPTELAEFLSVVYNEGYEDGKWQALRKTRYDENWLVTESPED